MMSEIITSYLLEGARNKDIASLLSVSRPLVSKIRARAVRDGLIPSEPKRLKIALPRPDATKALRAEARRRGIKVQDLITQLIETVATDDLFRAVLD